MWNRIMLTIYSVFVLTDPAWTGDMTHIPDRDFDTLRAAGNGRPQGIWSDGKTMWVADVEDDKIYAYNLRSKTHVPDRDFNTLEVAGNEEPTGIWSDGKTMWVADSYDSKIYAYSLRSKTRDPDKDFNTLYFAGNGSPRGIWSDGKTMWVTDQRKIYAYNLRSKTRDPDKDLSTSGIGVPGEIWSDGKTQWVVDHFDGGDIEVYNPKSKSHDPDRDLNNLLRAAGNRNPAGIWSDRTIMWVADASDGKIYAYGGQTVTSDQNFRGDQAIQDFPMKIKGTMGNLKICVRDHECEDGDKIRVNVEGMSIFSGEIDNDWHCYTLTVWAGESYAVEINSAQRHGIQGEL